MGVDFAANASSKAIKESVDLSAAPNDASATYTTKINASNQYEYTFNYNGTYPVGTGWATGNVAGMDGSVQSITLNPGKYLLEAWGAQGGLGNAGVAGGKGGYVKGVYTITGTSAVTIYVAVGGAGTRYQNKVASTNIYERGQAKGGGWNGGGGTISEGAATGGGATHFATTNRGELKNYKTYSSWVKNANQFEPSPVVNNYSGEILMVAGGGGGTWSGTTNGVTGAGGGTTGGEGGHESPTGTVWCDVNACHGMGGTQTTGGVHKSGAGTAHSHNSAPTSSTSHTGSATGQSGSWKTSPSNGYFGQGGIGIGDNWGGGGGGGGWFGGGGGYVYGGGGGSSYTKSGVITAPTGSTGVVHTQGAREGHGMARITDLTTCATQSSVPTVTLNRHDTKTFAFAGTNETNSLLGVDPNSLALSVHTNAVYQVNGLADNTTQETLRARTWAATEKADATTNAWLAYSFTSNGITLQATRYWTGTKAFYVRIKNAHGLPSWFKFYASVEGGELKKDKTLPE